MRFAKALPAALFMLAPPALAQGPAADDGPEAIYQQANAQLRKGNYLAGIAMLEGLQENTPGGSTYVQMRPALDGFVVMTEQRRRPLPAVNPAQLALYDGAEAREAIAEIVERAKRTRVVIVNEAHDNPRDRAFVLKVAEALRPLGYTVYAAETFSNWTNTDRESPAIEQLIADRVTRRDTGFYSAEPMFGYLIRRVMELGYRPLAYERSLTLEQFNAMRGQSRDEQIANREAGQAANLARAIVADPEARFLVHVGYAHAAERPLQGESGPAEWMAARLARLTGIDPLTVDQTELSEFAFVLGLRALHAALAPRVGAESRIFVNDGSPVRLGQNGEATDLQVVHPPIRIVRGRPDWLTGTGRRAVEIPAELLPVRGRRLVQVFLADDPEDAVPVDQALVVAGEAPPVVYLPDGPEVRWAVQGE